MGHDQIFRKPIRKDTWKFHAEIDKSYIQNMCSIYLHINISILMYDKSMTA